MADVNDDGFVNVGGRRSEDSTRNFIVNANREQLGMIARLIDEGQLRPVADAVFPLADARRACEHRATRGKVVLSVGR